MEQNIKEIFIKLGADICGIANVDRFKDVPEGFRPTDIYEDCKSVIVFAKCMPKGVAYVSPRIVYNKFNDINVELLDRIAFLGSIEVEKLGAIAVPVPTDSPYEYWDSENMEGKGILSMKHAAILAGIGTMGKNTLLINKTYGNMINIGAVLTNLDLRSDDFVEKVCIDGCTKCIDSCPSKALDGQTVNQKLCRQYAYGSNKRGFSIVNCSKCRVECPMAFGKR
jgi:Uncharacterized Fe-S protein